MSDMKIKCQDCGEPFIFTEKDQKFYEEKGFPPPKRCYFWRKTRKKKNLNYKKYNKEVK